MAEKILGIVASVLITLVVFVQVLALPGKDVLLGLFFTTSFFLSIYYLKENGANIYALVIFLYALSFISYVMHFFAGFNFFEVMNLSIAANVIFALLLFWTSRVLQEKIQGDSLYVTATAVVLLLHVGVLLFGNDHLQAIGTNLYYVLIGLIATIKIKREIDLALIPSEQKILNLILLVIAYPISNLVVSTIKNL